MRLEDRKVGSSLVVSVLDSRLGADVAVSFKEAMARLFQRGERSIVLDLSCVQFIDSTGLGAIVGSLKLVGREGELVVSGTRETVASMFKLTRMDKVFRIYPSIEEACRALDGGGDGGGTGASDVDREPA